MTKITQERLFELLTYVPESGEWFWNEDRGLSKLKGKRAGTVTKAGYRMIMIDGIYYMSSRLAFLYMTGSFPENTADHKDRNRSNDRWDNLRNATKTEQILNRKKLTRRNSKENSLPTGVYRHGKGYRVQFMVEGKNYRFGTFRSLDKAAEIAKEAYGSMNRITTMPS